MLQISKAQTKGRKMEKEPTATSKGEEGEKIAAQYLQNKGYQVLHTRWRHARCEVDIIAQLADVVVFVEVKTRYSNAYGMPWEAVNKSKRKKIIAAADAFLSTHHAFDKARFDIVSIIYDGQKANIEHIEYAFDNWG
jgi:putative endonuclease